MIKETKLVKVKIGNQEVGKLLLSNKNLCLFEYNREFISMGFSISPFYLPLKPGVFTAKRDPFNGLFGIFNDSLPDGWGNLLIDRYLRSKNINPLNLSVLDRLSLVGSSGMGALEFEPNIALKTAHEMTNLNQIANEIKKILGEEESTSLAQLVQQAGSSGGARPKVFIHIDNEPWIVKFRSSADPKNIGEIEYHYSLVAKKCKIEISETRLFEGKYFGVRRFDRNENKKIPMHSASGLLYASHRYPSLDYTELIKATLALTKNMQEALKVFRLMVFNVLTGNKDDHTKNFSFLHINGEWVFAPAYDLVPNKGFNGNHSTTISGSGNPTKKHIFETAQNCGLPQKKTNAIFEEVFFTSTEIHQAKI